ncbi:MAG: hypothetical protein J6V99_00670 [Neisseriaceae bacterium]|nr:hypothetical protein [Neisseriaceae bacterium]
MLSYHLELRQQQGISVEQAENDLMAQAMRDIDKQYADTHASYNENAENFLRKNASTFVDEKGATMLMFANMGYYTDSSKYAEQQGYARERQRLSGLNNQYSAAQRNAEINAKTASAIKGGTSKGVQNFPTDMVNGLIAIPNQIIGTNIPYLSQPAPYPDENQRDIGNWTSEKVGNAIVIGTLGIGSYAQEVRTAAALNRETQAARNAAKVESNIYTDQTYHPNVTQPARVNKTSKGTSIEYVADGDLAKARIDFDAFKPTNVTTTLNKKGELVTVGKLSNGGEVKLRPSNDGGRHRWTIEVRKPNGKVSREIRYGNQ